MPSLFDPVQAASLQLANRIVMAPLTRNRAPGALPTALMGRYYVQRASAGLIITEATAISHQGQGYIDVPGIWSEAQVAAWKKITDAVHAAGSKIVVQLWLWAATSTAWACACRLSHRPTMRPTRTRNHCSTTWCGSSGRCNWPTCM